MKETDLKIYFYKAECGDAARIKFLGTDNKYHNVFIDSGYKRTFKKIIFPHIKEIQESNEAIDLWVISHIHDDHIGGVLQYIKQIKSGQSTDLVRDWWYNIPRIIKGDYKKESEPISFSKSIRQGDVLSNYLMSKNKPSKTDFTSKNEVESIFGLKINILTPNTESLKKLRTKYEKSLNLPFEKMENETISDAKAIIKNDYDLKINEFNLSNWQEDNSIENESSISILTEYNGKKVLWLADSCPSNVVTSLKLMGYSTKNKLKCEWVKVSHHGSKRNNSDELYSLIECSNYLFSANGKNKHKLPSKECISRILRNENRNKNSFYKLVFTHDNEVLREIFKNEKSTIFKDLRFELVFSNKEYFQVHL